MTLFKTRDLIYWLKVFAVLPEDQSLVLSIHGGWVIIACNPSSRRFSAFFWPLWVPVYMVNINKSKSLRNEK